MHNNNNNKAPINFQFFFKTATTVIHRNFFKMTPSVLRIRRFVDTINFILLCQHVFTV
jgi:hypothetical protein